MQVLIRPILLFVLAAALTGGAAAASCEDDSILSVSSDGAILRMLSGDVFEVDPLDRVDTALWLPTEDVVVCDDEFVINKDENGEKAGVTRLR
jgi:hypothetical protein